MKAQRIYENGYRATEQFPEYIDHFMYFPSQEQADGAANNLLNRGWSTRVCQAAKGDDWLLLATQPATGNEEMEDVYTELSAFAEQVHGHYDGWERPADDPADDEDECLN